MSPGAASPGAASPGARARPIAGGAQADDAVALAILSHAVACGLSSAARAGIARGIDGAVAAAVTVALVSPIPWLAATAALSTGDVAAAVTLSLLVAAAATTALPVALHLAGPGAPLIVAALIVAHAPTRRVLGAAAIAEVPRAALVTLAAAHPSPRVSAAAAVAGLVSALLLVRAAARLLAGGLRRAR